MIISRRKSSFSEHNKFLRENIRPVTSPLLMSTVLLRICAEKLLWIKHHVLDAVWFLGTTAGSWGFHSQTLIPPKPYSAHIVKTLQKHESSIPLSYWNKLHCTKVKWEEQNSSSRLSSTNVPSIKLRHLVSRAEVTPLTHIFTWMPFSLWVCVLVLIQCKESLGQTTLKRMERWDCFFQQQCWHENKAWKSVTDRNTKPVLRVFLQMLTRTWCYC